MNVETLTVLVAGISVVIGVINSILSSRRAEKQRNVELLMQLYARWNSFEFRKAARRMDAIDWTRGTSEIVTALGQDLDVGAAFDVTYAFYEGLGLLVEEGYIDLDLVYDLAGYGIKNNWNNRFGPMIPDLRDQYNYPLLDQFEELYQKITALEKKRAIMST